MKLRSRFLFKNKVPLLLWIVLIPFLYLLSVLYTLLMRIRRYLFAIGLLPSTKLPIVVIGVGNLSVGGTGKTPVVIELAKLLSHHGKVGVAMRGYRSSREHRSKCLIVTEQTSLSFQEVGDEGCLIRRHLPSVSLSIGKNRAQGAWELVQKKQIQYLLLDDGFQHLRIKKTADVLVIDASCGLGGYPLPLGWMREPWDLLKQADFILLNQPIGTQLGYLVAETLKKKYDKPMAIFEMPLIGFKDREDTMHSIEPGSRVGVFCGIGNPERFLHTLTSYPFHLEEVLILKDHEPITSFQLDQWMATCFKKGIKKIICTEKDMVKIPSSKLDSPKIVWACTDFNFVQGKEGFLSWIDSFSF